MRTEEKSADFKALLDYLGQTRGFDFSSYKQASVLRRVQKRMQTVGVASYTDYIDLLEVKPEELTELFNTILINVTAFFRDQPAWDCLAEIVVPRILEARQSGAQIRAWTAGCASGEETLSLVMLMAERLGVREVCDRLKVFATDLDDDALAHARLASYSAKQVQGLPPDMLEKYFDVTAGSYSFNKELRRCIIFGRHDLLNDAPISRVDLLLCRNALMYFNSDAQERILERFHFALRPEGFLFLGKAETLLSHGTVFVPVDLRRRIFQKAGRTDVAEAGRDGAQAWAHLASGKSGNGLLLREAAFETAPVAQIIVDGTGILSLANARARNLLGIDPRSIGSPIQDVEVSYRPVELRSLIDRATAEGTAVTQKDVSWVTQSGDEIVLEVHVLPIRSNGSAPLGASVSFLDVTRTRELRAEVQHYTYNLETAYEELQSTNEELETTNEELQSTVEELETTNEELQSTNEELETMNEELQSTNEEIETINGELGTRTGELQRLNALLESILASMSDAVVVLDSEMCVLAWNERAHDLWGLRREEVRGKHFLNLDIGLPTESLRQPIRNCLAGGPVDGAVSIESVNRSGKAIVCRVSCTPLGTDAARPDGVIMVMQATLSSPEAN